MEVLNNQNKNFDYQQSAIEEIDHGECKNIFISGATLSGKSTCLHNAGYEVEGVFLIFLPSLALIDSMERKLNAVKIPTESITSGTLYADRNVIFDIMESEDSNVKFLLLTAEMMGNDADQYTIQRIKKLIEIGKITRIFIDDDVNSEGLRENEKTYKALKSEFPDVPWVFTTTVPNEVASLQERFEIDINDSRHFRFPEAARLDITYEVRKYDRNDDFKQMLVNDVKKLLSNTEKSGLIFTEYDNDCISYAKALTEAGIKSEAFYSKREDEDCLEIQKRWMNKEFPVLVANTESFRSAYVEVDLRFIINSQPSKSVKKYYQESGRGTDILARMYYQGGSYIDADIKPYIEFTGCRHLFIAQKLGHEEGDKCGNKCDNCINQQASPPKRIRTQ